MSVYRFLSPHMDQLYRDNPGISTPEAAAKLRELLGTSPASDPAHEEELIMLALGQMWGGFYGRIRGAARKKAKQATVRQTFVGPTKDIIVEALTQAMLPLPEGVRPLGLCSLIELRRSVTYMRQQQQGIGATLTHTSAVADQLEAATIRTGNPDLTVDEANELGLIDWERIAAAA